MGAYSDRIETLSDRVRAQRESFDPPKDIPDEDAAVEYLREGAGEATAIYIEARTGEFEHIDPVAFDRLETALNESLNLYAACYGVDIDADASIREAAELVLQTHSILETAVLLTGVPDRDTDEAWIGRK